MRIQWITKPSRVQQTPAAGAGSAESGHTLAGLLASAAALGVVAGALYLPFTAAVRVGHAMRDNLGATQIVMQKAEALRLFTGSQAADATRQARPLFVERDDPSSAAGSQGGMQYTGYLSTTDDAPSALRTHPRTVTVTICWTNQSGRKPVVHSRAVQARLAPDGMPKYIWGAL